MNGRVNDVGEPVIFLMGPTASGKTEAACALSKRFPIELISVDSALVYRGMDIGTAKPPPEILARFPHHLIDIREPLQTYSAAEFRDDARALIDSIHARGAIPLLVGGTGLYFRVLGNGIADLPSGSADVRDRLNADLARDGLAKMHERLAAIDPVSASRIHPNDPQRLIRALEVFEVSGRAMTTFFERQTETGLNHPIFKFVLAPDDRASHHERIASRFDTMLEAGLINEVARLKEQKNLSLDTPALRAVGYRAVWRYLDGDYDFATMRERGIIATRQLAKRQFTWFRADPDAIWLDAAAVDVVESLSYAIKRHLPRATL